MLEGEEEEGREEGMGDEVGEVRRAGERDGDVLSSTISGGKEQWCLVEARATTGHGRFEIAHDDHHHQEQ
eukprot:evm.model.NODE_28529_length_24012_cov_13.999084.5